MPKVEQGIVIVGHAQVVESDAPVLVLAGQRDRLRWHPRSAARTTVHGREQFKLARCSPAGQGLNLLSARPYSPRWKEISASRQG